MNGVEVAQHEGGFLPFDAVVTDIVRYNQYNKLSVLLNNELNEYMLPAGNTATLSNGKKGRCPLLRLLQLCRHPSPRQADGPCPPSAFWTIPSSTA